MATAKAGICATAQKKRALAYAKKGIVLALVSGVVFSLDSMTVEHGRQQLMRDNPSLFLLIPFICAGVHDSCAACVVTFFNWRQGRFSEIGRSFVSKPGRSVLFGACIGALLGMGGYMAALQLAGPAYVLPITSLYPAVAAVLAVFVLKERISLRAWFGLALCVGGAIIIGYMPPETQGGTQFYMGLLLAVLAAVGWGIEGVWATSGMDYIEPVVALNMYYIVSGLLFWLVIIPAMSFVVLPGAGGFTALLGIFESGSLLFLGLAGLLGSISYSCWYRAMNMTGVSRAMALNISYALWGILFSALFTDIAITKNLVAGAVIIFIGMFFVIGNPKDMLNLRKID